MKTTAFVTVTALLACLVVAPAAQAATVWTGPKMTFTHPAQTDPTVAEYQDRMTPKVWITRDTTKGIFNIATEKSYSETSPADTEWAYGTTATYATLHYGTWEEWHGENPPSTVGRDAVLHLISEDIYIDIKFTVWKEMGSGGFAYIRSTPGASTPTTTPVVEFYNGSLDHYFITWVADEISKLDAGIAIKGWLRTGQSFQTYTTAQAGTSPVCRYYIPPAAGDSHFFGRGTTECGDTGRNHPNFVLEDAAFMQMFLPVGGVCPANTTQVYRVFSNRPDANHRYMTDKAIRDRMVTLGWLAEGDGPDRVVMCAPL